MILIDSSCWIEFLRPGGDPHVRAVVADALEEAEAAVCDVTRVEILGNIARDREYEVTKTVFDGATAVAVDRADYDRGIAVGRALRKSGYAAPAVDLLLAAVALNRDALVLHTDRHFEVMGEVAGLRERFAGPAKA